MYRGSIILLILFLVIGRYTDLKATIKPDFAIPFEIYNNLIVLNLKVNDSPPLKFIYDSGSEHSLFFERSLAEFLRIKMIRSIQIYGSDLSRPMEAVVGQGVNFETSNDMLLKADIIVLDENIFQFSEYLGIDITGIIGNSLFRNKVIELDFDDMQIKVYGPVQYHPEEDGYTQMACQWVKGKPYIHIDVGFERDIHEEKMLLFDTGASIGLLLYSTMVDTAYLPSKMIPGSMGMGLGGSIDGFIGRIRELKIGEYTQKNLITYFQAVDSTHLENDVSAKEGIVGNMLISRYNVVLDFHLQHIYLKPNKSSKKKMPFDRSGLYLVAMGSDLKEYEVRKVMENTAAAEADIRVGDKIIRFKRMAVHNFTLGEINQVLSSERRKRIHLVILRDGKKMKKVLYLKDII